MSLLNFDKSLIACKDKCQPNEKVCAGCGRNEEQRLNWYQYSKEEKKKIIKLVNPE